MFKTFGNVKNVFVNQDEGMFVAFPMTLDENTLTLETETRNGRKYVKAGSIVKEGTSVKGVLAEEYDITDGPVTGRVVLEGYALASRLTASALESISQLPKIIVMPYKSLVVAVAYKDTAAHKLVIKALAGAKFKSTFGASDITVNAPSGANLVYSVNADCDELTITSAVAGEITVSAITGSGFVGAASGSTLKGLPIKETI
nr:MAG TPA: hypothetical protein [Caudoviricetes sp.]